MTLRLPFMQRSKQAMKTTLCFVTITLSIAIDNNIEKITLSITLSIFIDNNMMKITLSIVIDNITA